MTRPLVVDLDGTLIRTDLLVEALVLLASTRPLRALATLSALRSGRADLKARVAREVGAEPGPLPVNEEVLAFLRAEKNKGRAVYLATAAHHSQAHAVAQRIGLFDDVFASDAGVNLKGAEKARLLCQHFGEGGFDYVGNDSADLEVWAHAGGVIVANASPALTRTARERFPNAVILAPRRAEPADYFRALRLHQWLKNLLVFVPAFAAHRFDGATVLSCIVAFLAFGLCASGVYLMNDLLDLRHDRDHPTKRNRPFASGQVDVAHGLVMIPVALAGAVLLALALPGRFLLVLSGYLALTLVYSLVLKRWTVLDVMALAALYAMRLAAGGAAVGVAISPWLLTFAVFLFMSLALVKRSTELRDHDQRGHGDPAGRGYLLSDLPILQNLAGASGYASVLVLCLYVNSATVETLYLSPEWMWGLPMIHLYWISRMLLLTHRGLMHEDPVLFAATDKISLACAVLMVAVAMVSL